MQLDLFLHSTDVALRNNVLAALARHDAHAAEQALEALRAQFPQDRLLEPARRLLAAMTQPARRFADHAEAAEALKIMDNELVPCAAEVFDARQADAWLAPLWRALAESTERLPYDPRLPRIDAAAMLLRSGDWAAVEAKVAAIPSWRRLAAPLAWMAEARFRQGGLERAWGLLAELAWIDAPRFGELVRRLDSPPLRRLLDAFDAGFEPAEEAELAWFPAWALIAEPGLALPFHDARRGNHTPPERAARLVFELLTLERQGRHDALVAQRKRLRELQPVLFARYMSSR